MEVKLRAEKPKTSVEVANSKPKKSVNKKYLCRNVLKYDQMVMEMKFTNEHSNISVIFWKQIMDL